MVEEKVIKPLDELVVDGTRMAEAINKLSISEPVFSSWMREVANNVAEKHAKKIMQLAQSSSSHENFLGQMAPILVTSHMACIATGFFVHQAHADDLWMEVFGMKNPEDMSAKFSAFLSGALTKEHYENLDMKNPLNAEAIKNFERRRNVQGVLSHVEKTERK